LSVNILPHPGRFGAVNCRPGFWSSCRDSIIAYFITCFVPDLWHWHAVDITATCRCAKNLNL
jgi:hypothetical protein